MQKIRHLFEAALLQLLFTAFRLLPLDAASYIGGFMARALGPFLSAHKTAEKNLSMVFPEWTREQKHRVLTGMWDNLGRVAAELPHLPGEELHRRISLSGEETLPPPGGKPVIFFSGHLGNWELTYPIAHRHGIPTALIYREANNPHVDAMIKAMRASHSTSLFPKGAKGAIALGRAIKSGQSLALLIDQKMNEGLPVPFFGRDAMTAPAIAEFALRYDMPLIPARVIRTQGCHFKGSILPPLAYEKTGDREKDVLSILTAINALLETWIREYPAQWFWVHRRWPK